MTAWLIGGVYSFKDGSGWCHVQARPGAHGDQKVVHGRSHVRRGEAVELLKEYPTSPPMSSRIFVAAGDPEVESYITKGYTLQEVSS